jgi:DNA (cytosine-5)-methyltransferase 1
MNGLDLFSGIGGIGLGLREWVRVVSYCEQDKYAQGVLLSRMQSGEIDRAPIWDDVRTLRAEDLPSNIEIIFGGFPCQDISIAGNGIGLDGQRSGLFFEILRLVKELKPAFVFLENVPAIRTRGSSRVCFELASLGYDLRWTTLSAASVGAPHKRERWFLLAHANSTKLWDANESKQEAKTITRNNGEKKLVANTTSERLPKPGSSRHEKLRTEEIAGLDNRPELSGWWAVEPSVGRVVNGLPNRVDRIKCLGNSVVPLQVKTAFERLMGLV